MIFGVGTDIVELSRIQATYDRFGDHFVQRLLMPEELELFSECLPVWIIVIEAEIRSILAS